MEKHLSRKKRILIIAAMVSMLVLLSQIYLERHHTTTELFVPQSKTTYYTMVIGLFCPLLLAGITRQRALALVKAFVFGWFFGISLYCLNLKQAWPFVTINNNNISILFVVASFSGLYATFAWLFISAADEY